MLKTFLLFTRTPIFGEQRPGKHDLLCSGISSLEAADITVLEKYQPPWFGYSRPLGLLRQYTVACSDQTLRTTNQVTGLTMTI